jgi:hypothetical protein
MIAARPGQPTRGVEFLSFDKQQAFIEFCAENGIRGNFVVAGYRDTDDMIRRRGSRIKTRRHFPVLQIQAAGRRRHVHCVRHSRGTSIHLAA